MSISIANPGDIPELVALLNSAYRGEESKKGWTTEADIVAGDLRTDESNMNELMKRPGAIFLKSINAENKIEGCVFLETREGKLYLGMLCVSPYLQARGIGKQLMSAAENYAMQVNYPAIYMRVISIRDELLAWYERQGYYRTGEIQPFPDGPFGIPIQPIEFVVLQKDFR